MNARTEERVGGWNSRSFTRGYAGLRDLADEEFSGVVETEGGAWLCMLNGKIVGVFGGSIDAFEDASGTAHVAPDPALPLLFAMEELGGTLEEQYYTKDTPISEADATLTSGSFTGYIELSENVLSGDYYVCYYGGRSMPVAFVGNSERLATGDDAFDRADDEVGIYDVYSVDVDVTEVPEPEGAGSGPDRSTGRGGPAAGSRNAETRSGGRRDERADDRRRDGPPGGSRQEAPAGGSRQDRGTGARRDDRAGESRRQEQTAGGSRQQGSRADSDRREEAPDDRGTRDDRQRQDDGTTRDDRQRQDDGTTRDDRQRQDDGTTREGSGEEAGPGGWADGEPAADDGGDDAETSDSRTGGRALDDRPSLDDDSPLGDLSEQLQAAERRDSALGGSGAGSGSDGGPSEESSGSGRESPDRDDGSLDGAESNGDPLGPGPTGGPASREESPGGSAESGREEDRRGEATGGEDPGDRPIGGGLGGSDLDARERGGDRERSRRSGDDPDRTDPAPSGPVGGDPGDRSREASGGVGEEPSPERPQSGTDPREEDRRPGRGDDRSRQRRGEGEQPVDGGGSGDQAGGQQREGRDGRRFQDEAAWREERSVPSITPAEEREELLEELQDGIREREAEIDRLRERVSTLESDRESDEAERERLRSEVEELSDDLSDLRRTVLRLDEAFERLESATGGADDAGGSPRSAAGTGTTAGDARGAAAGPDLTPRQALEGTKLLVRYGSRGKPTLKTAHGGGADSQAVNDNLQLNVHTDFPAEGATVDGQSFREFLDSRMEFGFVEWLVRELPFEIRETGNAEGLKDLYDAIPQIDRVELAGQVTIEYLDDEDREPERIEFDVVARDDREQPLVVANFDDSGDPATQGMVIELNDRAGEVREAGPLNAAFLVTSSYFDGRARDTASDATSGSFLSRDSRKSFVNTSRKRGYHLCLVESRGGDFHVRVPEL